MFKSGKRTLHDRGGQKLEFAGMVLRVRLHRVSISPTYIMSIFLIHREVLCTAWLEKIQINILFKSHDLGYTFSISTLINSLTFKKIKIFGQGNQKLFRYINTVFFLFY